MWPFDVMNNNWITGPVHRAYLYQFRLRAHLHWLIGMPLCFVPAFLILGIMHFSDLRLEAHYYWALGGGAVVGIGFTARMHGLVIAIGRRKELTIHLPKTFVAAAVEQRSPMTHFVFTTARITRWAQQNGFRTVSMDSPLLHKARRREQIASALQQALGPTVRVSAVASLRRMSFLEHWAFLHSRGMAGTLAKQWQSAAFQSSVAEPASDGLSRVAGRLLTGRITISLQP
nr:hypothetical protein [Cupriavidus gilardii]